MRILIVLALVASCTQHNPNVCCTDQADCDAQGLPLGSVCGQGLICRGNQCIAETCSDASTCDAAAPYCVMDLCGESCTADLQCPGFGQSASDKFCVGGVCSECRVGMADCPMTAPICDAGTCRGCVLDDDCPSRVCTAMTGMCMDVSQILYASPDGLPATDCSIGAPCTIASALALVGGAKTTIRMLPGTYAVDLVIGMGLTASIVGTGATVSGAAGTGPMLSTDSNTNLTVRGLTLSSSTFRRGIQCLGSGAASMVALIDVTVDAGNGGGEGIVATNCHLALSRSKVQAGVVGEDASTIAIDRSDLGDLNMGFGKNLSLEVSNTVARAGITIPTGPPYSAHGHVSFSTFGMIGGVINCVAATAAITFSNDIFMQDPSIGAPSVVAGDTSCYDHDIEYPQVAPVGTNIMIVDPKLVDQTHYDFHIKLGSQAIDTADPAATDAFDYDGIARPQGAGRDLGAFEYH